MEGKQNFLFTEEAGYTLIRGQQNLQVGEIHLHLAPPLSGF